MLAGIYRNQCSTLGVKIVYKKLKTNEWFWEEKNPVVRSMLLDKKYDFSVELDIAKLSSEAAAFLKRITLLYDPELAARSTKAIDAAVRDSALLHASTTTPSGRRVSTRKKSIAPTVRTPAVSAVSKPKARNRQKKQQPKYPSISMADSSDDESPVRIASNHHPAKKADLKATPPKAESDEVKALKEAMSSMRSELTSTRLLFEEFLMKDSSKTASEVKASASDLPQEKLKDQLAIPSNILKRPEEDNPTESSRINYSTIPESRDSLAIHVLDFQQRELLSRQAIQLAKQNAREMEQEVIQGRKDYHELHMLLLKSLAGRR